MPSLCASTVWVALEEAPKAKLLQKPSSFCWKMYFALLAIYLPASVSDAALSFQSPDIHAEQMPHCRGPANALPVCRHRSGSSDLNLVWTHGDNPRSPGGWRQAGRHLTRTPFLPGLHRCGRLRSCWPRPSERPKLVVQSPLWLLGQRPPQDS